MKLVDAQLVEMCRSVGLAPEDVEDIYDGSSQSVGRVLARITEYEAAQFARIAAGQPADADPDAGPVGQPVAGTMGEQAAGVGTTRWRRNYGDSFSLSVRLDHDEVEELRRRARQQNVGVSVIARAYIRQGLAKPPLMPADW